MRQRKWFRLDEPSPRTDHAARIGWVLLSATLLGGAGCDSCGGKKAEEPAASRPRCTAEVTAGRGTHRVSAPLAEGQTKKALRKELFAEACTKLCESDGEGGDALGACQARCEVDITAEKVGARFSCE